MSGPTRLSATQFSTPPASGFESCRCGWSNLKSSRALAGGEYRHRVPVGRDVRHHRRRLTPDRPGARSKGRFCRLWIWRQRHHLQLSRRAIDRRPDCGIYLATPERFRAGPGWQLEGPLMAPLRAIIDLKPDPARTMVTIILVFPL